MARKTHLDSLRERRAIGAKEYAKLKSHEVIRKAQREADAVQSALAAIAKAKQDKP